MMGTRNASPGGSNQYARQPMLHDRRVYGRILGMTATLWRCGELA